MATNPFPAQHKEQLQNQNTSRVLRSPPTATHPLPRSLVLLCSNVYDTFAHKITSSISTHNPKTHTPNPYPLSSTLANYIPTPTPSITATVSPPTARRSHETPLPKPTRDPALLIPSTTRPSPPPLELDPDPDEEGGAWR
ncbi:hypothetical protein Vafri_18727, partial [Volvox africanus]